MSFGGRKGSFPAADGKPAAHDALGSLELGNRAPVAQRRHNSQIARVLNADAASLLATADESRDAPNVLLADGMGRASTGSSLPWEGDARRMPPFGVHRGAILPRAFAHHATSIAARRMPLCFSAENRWLDSSPTGVLPLLISIFHTGYFSQCGKSISKSVNSQLASMSCHDFPH